MTLLCNCHINMKTNMFYCASQASTATANDERSTMARAIDRHNPIIKDGRRSFSAPCSSGDDYIAPYRQISRIPSSSSSSGDGKNIDKGRKSNSGSLMKLINSSGCVVTPKTPPGSTRYLLGSDPVSLSGSTGQDGVVTKEEGEASSGTKSVQEKKKKTSSFGSEQASDEDVVLVKMSGMNVNKEDDFMYLQVVVLRLLLHCHCRGCQGKVKKHLSKMQGVTSFNIDFASKKVTVTGDITPLEVLGCLSKVKNAQFWTPS